MVSPRCGFDEITALAVLVCLHFVCVTYWEIKKCLGVYQALGSTSICMASLVLSCRKNPGKIGIFGDVPCFMLLLVGVVQNLRS